MRRVFGGSGSANGRAATCTHLARSASPVEEIAGESGQGQNQQDVDPSAQREPKGADADAQPLPVDAGLMEDRPDDAELDADDRQRDALHRSLNANLLLDA